MYRLNYCQPGALPPFRAFALTAREGLVALPRVSLPSVAGPGLQALPPAEVEGWPSAILNAAYGAYTMETICGTTHCDCLPDSNIFFPIVPAGRPAECAIAPFTFVNLEKAREIHRPPRGRKYRKHGALAFDRIWHIHALYVVC